MRIGDVDVQIGPDFVHTTFLDGSEIHAYPGRSIEDFARAEALGYGVGEDAVVAMTRDHDVLHSLLAEARGQRHSAALWGVAHNEPTGQVADDEERIVMLLHRVSRVGINAILADYAVQPQG